MPELLRPIGKRVEDDVDSPEVFRPRLVDVLLAPLPLPLVRGRSRVWLARAKSDGRILASWTGSARPDPATALPGHTAATLEILEMPREVVETRGGRRQAARDAVSGESLLDPFGQGRGMRDRWGQAVTDATARGAILYFVLPDLTEILIKSANGTFWAVRVSDAGVLSTTSLGTTTPDYAPAE